MQKWIQKFRGSALARNTGWALAGNGFRLVIQAAYFILVARSLGPQNYGAFAAAIALVGILRPFVGLGSQNLLVKHVARDRLLFSEAWGRGMFIMLFTGPASILLICAGGRLLAGSIPALLLFYVAVSELFLFKIVELCMSAFNAFENLARYAQVNALVSICRMLGIVCLVRLKPHPTATAWGAAYLIATVVATLHAVLLVKSQLGLPRPTWRNLWKDRLEGLYFSTGVSAQTIYNDIDKTMLARMGTLTATGIYAAAYRLIDVSFVPVSSLMAAAYPRFFRKGTGGTTESLGLAKRLLVWSIAYAAGAFLLVLLLAPVVPRILGSGYENAVEALRWLALLPVLKACHYLFADALTGAGFQGLRTLMQVIVAIFNVLINLWLIPAYSWRGAAWSSLLSDGLLALLMWAAATALSRREQRSRLEPAIAHAGTQTREPIRVQDSSF